MSSRCSEKPCLKISREQLRTTLDISLHAHVWTHATSTQTGAHHTHKTWILTSAGLGRDSWAQAECPSLPALPSAACLTSPQPHGLIFSHQDLWVCGQEPDRAARERMPPLRRVRRGPASFPGHQPGDCSTSGHRQGVGEGSCLCTFPDISRDLP